jgi:predicted restriction endonuclease
MSHSKRSRSPSVSEQQSKKLRTENSSANLLSDLSNVLNTIKSTPPSGEISAEVMETFKILLLEIEKRSSDENNLEAKQMKDQSDRCLETWFDELLALCDGELDLDEFELTEEEEDSIALALELQEEQDEEDEEIDIEIVDDGSEVGSQVQLTVS